MEATCRIGDAILVGKVCDVSPGGMFFAPEYAGGEDGLCGDVCAADYVAAGDLVTFTVDGFSREIKAEVCWVGESDRHARAGLGVRYVQARSNYGLDRLHELRAKLAKLNVGLMLASAGGLSVSDREMLQSAQHNVANGLQCAYAVEAKMEQLDDHCLCKCCRKSHPRRDSVKLSSGVFVCDDCSKSLVVRENVFDLRVG